MNQREFAEVLVRGIMREVAPTPRGVVEGRWGSVSGEVTIDLGLGCGRDGIGFLVEPADEGDQPWQVAVAFYCAERMLREMKVRGAVESIISALAMYVAGPCKGVLQSWWNGTWPKGVELA